jgi:ribosome assembly protein YihI (activator of Der GTPase)
MPNTKEGELLSKLAMLPATYAREYLDLIQLLLEQLGLDAEDPRLAITIPKHRRTPHPG